MSRVPPTIPSPIRSDLRRGSTLVEVAIACVVLAVIAVGTAACLSLARGQASIQRDRRMAMEIANSRLEDIRCAAYSDLANGTLNYNVYYLDKITGTWRLSTSDQGETVAINNRRRAMTTTAQYNPADGDYDCLLVSASVQYGNGPKDVVTLSTIKAP